MSIQTIQHFVFVDFENVPSVDLALVKDRPVHVTLLIGKKQTKLDTDLSLQLNEYAKQVSPIQVEASGRNALDMILACYLGRSVERYPEARFTVVSKDKDFTPVLGHLAAQGVKVVRCDTFAAAFSFQAKPTVTSKSAPSAKPKPVVDRLSKLIEQLKEGRNRPKKQSTLEHHVSAFHGNKLSEVEVANQIKQLIDRGVIAIDEKGKISYL